MKKYVLLLTLFASMLLVGCGGELSPEDQIVGGDEQVVVSDASTTIGGKTFDLYPESELYQNLVVSLSYTVDADPTSVENFYDDFMSDEGYTFAQDWVQFGEQRQKNFIRGGDTSGENTADELVKIAVGPYKDGGTLYLIMPIPNYSNR